MTPETDLFSIGLQGLELKLTSHLRRQLRDEFEQWKAAQRKQAEAQLRSVPRAPRKQYAREDAHERRRRDGHELRQLLDFLLAEVPTKVERLQDLRIGQRDFRETMAISASEEDRRRLVLEYAGRLGRSRRQLAGDKRAVDRWFGQTAITSRFRRRLGEGEQLLEFAVRRLGVVVRQVMTICENQSAIANLWQRTRIADVFASVLEYDGDVRVRRAAWETYAIALEHASATVRQEVIAASQRDAAYALASDDRADTWLQTAAFDMLRLVDEPAAQFLAQGRLSQPQRGDDIFVRRHLVRQLATFSLHDVGVVDSFAQLVQDPSEFVRQQAATTCWHLPCDAALYYLSVFMLEDESPKVRAAAVASALDVQMSTASPALAEGFLRHLGNVLRSDDDEFVLRTAMHVAGRLSALLTPISNNHLLLHAVESACQNDLLPAIRLIQHKSPVVRLRRWAAEAAEIIWTNLDREARTVLEGVAPLAALPQGKSKWFSRKCMGTEDHRLLGRVLAVSSREDFGFDLRSSWGGFWVWRPPQFLTRAWRILHELRTPSTDKRQAFPHTIGRVSNATLRVPSRVLAELSKTKVPGEPLFLPDENGWRPFLPLVDDFLSALGTGWLRPRTVEVFSSEGLTTITPPKTVWQRIWAWCSLTVSFANIAELRNLPAASSPGDYVNHMRSLGFEVGFESYHELGRRFTDPGQEQAESARDATVVQHFGCLLATGIPLFDAVQKFSAYFKSVYENSLFQLTCFISIAILLFLCSHFLANFTLRRARQRLALSIGGWGTRGKSGTERLKASLLSGMGYSLLCKTTGCEAMFLLGEPYGETREIPLFRPFDKATIWEQRNVLEMAANTDSSVFLWECMGLSPDYVDVLQRQWTCDDLVTLTNAYPDHEDLQGPAGWNVASTIAGFAPRKAPVLTTEFQMLPLIRSACDRVGSTCSGVSWLQSGLLTDEVLERFPYSEHPDNIALVCAMGQQLGVASDFSLKEMADHLVVDLGVLRTYPVACVATRRLEFTNGMSANERTGCMGNWKRAGFADHDPAEEPQVWITTLVNNRADRVSRSKVFAAVLVEDMQADRHVVIGGNLPGLMGFVREAWNDQMDDLSLWGNDDIATNTWKQQAGRLRIPTSMELVRGRILAMLSGISEDRLDAIQVEMLMSHVDSAEGMAAALLEANIDEQIVEQFAAFHHWMLNCLSEFTDLYEHLSKATGEEKAALEKTCKAQLQAWFEQKFVVVDDYYATGEQVIQRIVEATPPGLLNRNMGLQNIKGTGLGFVYEWQGWLKIHQWCQDLLADVNRAEAAALSLMEYQQVGILGREELERTLAQLKRDGRAQSLPIDIASLEQAAEAETADVVQPEVEPALVRNLGFLWGWIEDVLDAGDAVRRRWAADGVYRELQADRFCVDEAIAELRELNTRQKGGWLRKWLLQKWPGKKPASHTATSSPEPLPVEVEEGGRPFLAAPRQHQQRQHV